MMNKEEIFNILKEAINYILPEIEIDGIAMEDSLKEIGANSVDRAEIIYMTLEDANVKLPMVSFNDAHNINDIIDIIVNANN